ncbi:hypothetical protein [Inhella proteolytica]|uniref:Uncharacterized protein n=1 Tax=Inhella proteolytica TaxID=2795029 RepID=A0A931J939_9BURK|nr:hypothetical protein [Inhella proteolytica]MBH9578632.1 hypothetical protein [Inhella proteolytica]
MRTLLLCFSLCLTACASQPQEGAQAGVQKAALTPLSDLNLVRADIPPVLQAARKAPYAAPANCAAGAQNLAELDAVLGADLDSPPDPNKPSLLERGSDAVGAAAGKALQSAAEGVIPFRGWVRKLSGAERYDRAVAAAITAGAVRRGFLKGWAGAQACP